MWIPPIFIIALHIAYKKDMKEYLSKYDKRGQYRMYQFVQVGFMLGVLVSIFLSI